MTDVNKNEAIKKVVIVGRDADAWLTALALQLSFAQAGEGVEVCLLELPSTLCPQDFYVTLPTQQAFHHLLGLDENKLLRACSGVYSLGQRFSNWSGTEPSFLHAYDSCGVPMDHVEFLQYWIKARANGLNVPLENFSIGAVAAKQGRMVVFNETTESFSKATHGYHFKALAYLKALGRAAISAGLQHRASDIKNIEMHNGLIQSVTLQDGTKVAGDLFIDASGGDGVLISQLENIQYQKSDTQINDVQNRNFENNNYQPWQGWLPCDRIMVASAPALNPTPAFSQISAFENGWIGVYPLLNKTAITAVYSSEASQNTEVLKGIYAMTGLKIIDPIEAPFAAGARQKHWLGNCVALGSTAVNLGPLDGLQLHMLHTGISFLISLFPVSKNEMPEADIFNQKMNSHARNARDFQISHYKLNRRFGEPFWDKLREKDAPESLQQKIALFKARGLIAMREDETFQEESWTSIFLGHGLFPRSYDPLVDRLPEQQQIEQFQQMLQFIAREVESMPSLQAHIELNSPASNNQSSF